VTRFDAQRSMKRRSPARRNPSMTDIKGIFTTAIFAGAGDLLGRWVTNLAGEMEDNKPGIKHAIAYILAAQYGAPLLGQAIGSPEKGKITQIGTYAYATSLFLRRYFLDDQQWAKENLNLSGEELTAEDLEFLTGLEEQSAIAGSFAVPPHYRQIVADTQNSFSGLEEQSALAGQRGRASSISSFGYVS
jgi:hypothetical protein